MIKTKPLDKAARELNGAKKVSGFVSACEIRFNFYVVNTIVVTFDSY